LQVHGLFFYFDTMPEATWSVMRADMQEDSGKCHAASSIIPSFHISSGMIHSRFDKQGDAKLQLPAVRWLHHARQSL